MKIYQQKNGSMTQADALELATLLIKAGYTVSVRKEKNPAKTSETRMAVVNAIGEGEEAE